MVNYNMPVGVTPISHAIHDLHMTIFWVCVAIASGVFSVLIFALCKHRRSRGHIAASFHENLWVEIIWTTIPFIILGIMAVPATKVLLKINDSTRAEINIKVVGYQWRWKYVYLDEGLSFLSSMTTSQDEIHNKSPKKKWYLLDVDHPLVLPIHKKIRLLITSNDVNHSWWVPELGVKMDAVPGYIHETWLKIEKPGIYRGQCAELCGMGHAFMPIVVIAKTKADYDAWLKAQVSSKKKLAEQSAIKKVWTKEALITKGKKDYATYCAVCHKPDGKGMPPAFPALKGGAMTTGLVNKHINIVLHGKPGTAMQSFSQLSDDDIASIITYERHAWGNADKKKYGKWAGGLVQPSDIKKARGNQ